MSRAILVHGSHPLAHDRDYIVWGNPHEGLLGRASKALVELAREPADLVVWGTGAVPLDPLPIRERVYKMALTRAPELPEYNGLSVAEVEARIGPISELDYTSRNTIEEIASMISRCIERGIRELVLVSSPSHIGRCITEAEKLRARLPDPHALRIIAMASDTCERGSSAADVVVIEPPHRGDRPRWQTHRYVRAMLGLMWKDEHVFERFLSEIGDLLRQYGVTVDWKPKSS